MDQKNRIFSYYSIDSGSGLYNDGDCYLQNLLIKKFYILVMLYPLVKMGHFNFFIPDDLHKQFKIYAIKKGKDMKDLLVEQIRNLVEE